MSLHRSLVAGAVASALILCAAVPASVAATKPSAPVIHETFTLLACPSKPQTTVQVEGCAEHRVVAIDRTIDGLNAKAFAKLGTSGRASFVTANTAWVQYRDAVCASQSSIYHGGSVQPVAYADCLVAIDKSHVSELKKVLLTVSLGG